MHGTSWLGLVVDPACMHSITSQACCCGCRLLLRCPNHPPAQPMLNLSRHAGQLCQLHLHYQGRHPRQLHRGPDHQVRQLLSCPVLLPTHRPGYIYQDPLLTSCGLCRSLSETLTKKNKNSNVKAFMVKNYLSVFINAMIENPAFDSQVHPPSWISLLPACRLV